MKVHSRDLSELHSTTTYFGVAAGEFLAPEGLTRKVRRCRLKPPESRVENQVVS
jgi:hypothetical protein